MNRKKRLIMVVLCVLSFLVLGCSYREFEDGIKEKQAQKELDKQYEEVEQAQTIEPTESTEEGRELPPPPEYIEIKTGPLELARDDFGKANYIIDNVRFYENFEDNEYGIEESELDFCGYIDEMGFLLMDVTIENLTNHGREPKSDIPLINITTIGVRLRESVPLDYVGWYGSYPNYFDKKLDDEKNAWCIAVKKGETEHFMLGFFLPTKNKEELSDYVIAWCEGKRYEIPAVCN